MLFVRVTQMYKGFCGFLCNAVLVAEILCYQYSTINNSVKNIFNEI